MTIREEDGILSEENNGKNQDILCSVLLQQYIVRTKEEVRALHQGEALLKKSSYTVRASVGSNCCLGHRSRPKFGKKELSVTSMG